MKFMRIAEAENAESASQARELERINEHIDYVRQHPDDKGCYNALMIHFDEFCELLTSDSGEGQSDSIVKTIMNDGTYEGRHIDISLLYHKQSSYNSNYPHDGAYGNSAYRMLSDRLLFGVLARYERLTFETLLKKDTVALHGTNGVLLPNILGHKALLSHYEQYERGLSTGSGEVFGAAWRRRFISFDELSSPTALRYAQRDLRSPDSMRSLRWHAPTSEGYKLRLDEVEQFNEWLEREIENGDEYLKAADRLRFGMVLGLSRAGLFLAGLNQDIGKRIRTDADASEFSFVQQVGINHLPVIGVDDEGLERVSALLESCGVADKFTLFSLTSLRRAHDIKDQFSTYIYNKYPYPHQPATIPRCY